MMDFDEEYFDNIEEMLNQTTENVLKKLPVFFHDIVENLPEWDEIFEM